MREVRAAVAQFEATDGEKERNLERVRGLSGRAAALGAELVCFHECCVTGYTFLEGLSREELGALAEPVPDGPSTEALVATAREHGIVVGAGLVERGEDGRLHNTYVVAGPGGVIGRHAKLHPFISEHLDPGEGYTLVEALGCTFGVLTCYDNNVIENVRVTTLLGAEAIIMPHVTGGTPSPVPGRGVIAREVWENRERDPVTCRRQFAGPKGREWIMRWLPARAHDNGVYVLFANAVGVDADTVKPGCSMIIDPFGDVLAECRELGDGVVAAVLTPEKVDVSGGRRYIRARRPELYGRLVEPVPEEERRRSSSRHADVWWKRRPAGGEGGAA